MTERPGPGPTVHEEVASYAIGALDDAEATRFEEHLVDCEACARRLEGFLPVVGLLPDVPMSAVDLPPRPIELDPDDIRARHRRRRGLRTAPASVHGLVSATRSQLRRPVVAAAAAAVAAVAVSAGVFGELAYDERFAPSSSPLPAASAAAPWDGLSGPDLEGGRKVTATDAATGVRADMVLDSVPWGTRVSFALSELDGPQDCRLVAVRRDGSTVVLSSWVVPPLGYGNAQQSRPLVLQAATSLAAADIAALRVEAVGQGAPRALVTVPA